MKDVAEIAETAQALAANIARVLIGKDHIVRLALTSLLSGGHLLLDDNPGTGKTSLAKAIAASIDGTGHRIQFTPDLLPGDITGVSIWDAERSAFEFHGGPIFANVVLADEINRASPKTQSALLEVMQEGKVTVDGVPHEVPKPFMVIATQNPIEQTGTYRLPEAQLDRFALTTSIGYPDHASLLRILDGSAEAIEPEALEPVTTAQHVAQLVALTAQVHVAPTITDYIARLVEATRNAEEVRLGLSVRGALALIRTARTYAAIDGRDFVRPDDIKALAIPVIAHRLVLAPEAEFDGVLAESIVQQIVLQTKAPRTGE